MEYTNGRSASEAPADDEDFYGDDTPTCPTLDTQEPVLEVHAPGEPTLAAVVDGAPAVTATAATALAAATVAIAATEPEAVNVDDEDDSSSEMDLSSPSRSSTPEPVALPATSAAHAGAKRKLSDATDANDGPPVSTEDSAKKRKLSVQSAKQDGEKPRIPQLPPEVWQRVFLHLPPAMLCRCLRVSKPFNEYLTNTSAPPAARKDRPKLQVLDSESIWAQSRKSFFPTLPRPLAQFSELDMLKLIGGRACQFCHRPPVFPPATTVLNAGPGPNGLRVIWPFGIRSCGLCLQQRSLKDVQVLGDPSLGRLRNGVTHGFLSPDLHFAAESVRQTVPGGIPGNLRFSKIYYMTDLDAIKGEEESARALGSGAVDEWHKGLSARGKESMADSARWEKWELQQLRPGQDLAQVLREYDLASFPRHGEEVQRRPVGVNGVQLSPTANGVHPLPQPVHFFQNGYANHFQMPPQPPQHYLPAPPPFPAPMPPQHFFRPIRNPQEVEEARQARKAEIERRCREFEPSLEPNVLQHMESFQAAMQITTPMTDSAWEMLKPRIMAQRETAELAEHERASQLAALQAALPSGNMDDFVPRPAKETYDREYEQAQEPLRKQLAEYADDYVNGKWGGGKMLDKDNAPLFAIHALTHIRERYAEDKSLGLLPRFEPPKPKNGAKQGSPPMEPFLSLDNMKWVYDNKVRPLTDVHRREHFICAGCAEEKKPKWFAFEGLIQHYGAKHTTAFSKGNIVVHWQTAEWPEEPPFHSNPSHWLKLDRRSIDYKHNGRARSNPHGYHEGPFPAQSTPALSETPYHAATNGYPTVSPSYPPHYASPVNGPTNGYFHQPPSAAAPDIDISHDAQVAKLSSDAREIWDALDGVKDMMECIRIHTVIYHAIIHFVERFHQKPPLDLITDALATNALMRPLKNAHGLACRSCVAAQPNGVGNNGSYWIRIKGVKVYNTSSLITHLKVIHQPQVQGGFLDWTRDMIELPEAPLVKDLLRAPGMNDDKLALVAAAFPSAFPAPLPKIGVVSEEASQADSGRLPASRLLNRLSKKQKAQARKKGAKQSNGVADGDDPQEAPLPEPTEDEYDPRRPMFVPPKEQVADPSQFDTDARKNSPPPAATSAAGILDLAPETLAVLQSLGVLPAKQQQGAAPQNRRGSRSPSVGRAEPIIPRQDVSNPPVTTPSGAPDIAAILASLTGQAAPLPTATPPLAAGDTPGSMPRQYQHDQHGKPNHEPIGRQRHNGRRPSSRYEPASPPSHNVGNVDLHALQAALSQNGRHFEHNQQQLHTYVDAPWVPQPQPTPRYHYVYEGEQQYSQSQAHTPTYREAHVQYTPLPEREPARYQYEQPVPPKMIYVDQYGRPLELIPIDSATAPVQYATNPYEQQQYGRQHEQPMYTSAAPAAHLQPVYDDRRPMYYEPIPPNGVTQRYTYDDARASVPRN
ncbi:hypothetical protein DOTSEDRAFT_68697 [Dothistroma septosporum NZE10]|uniref:Uncharacterized protein n=1 Tax=Dothistroma septosporum (strain NZE10 / CBS 128990) TaxID=675120 RepID=N1Q4W9_DOTSN|nr:hypothetical protein DOTSEDRAFT_68697 [Dothistroma septosporum NZE10]